MLYIKWLNKIIIFIKNNWKNVVIIILLATLFLFLLRKPSIKIIKEDNSELIKELKQYKDRSGNLVSELTQLKISKEEMINRVDSLSYELKISKKNIKTVDHYITDIDTQFYPKSVPIFYNKDTAYKVIQKDKWLTAEAVAGKDTGYIYLRLTDELDRVEEYKPGFLGLFSKTNVYLRSKSPYINYNRGYSFSIKEKTTWLTIGPSIQYDPFQNKVSVGISAQFPIIKIKK